MSREKFLAVRAEKKAESDTAKITYARIGRKSTGWEVYAVDLPESVAQRYERVAAEFDLYPNQERKLLIEARKTDFDKWK